MFQPAKGLSRASFCKHLFSGVEYFRALRYQVFANYSLDPKLFRLEKEVLLKKFAKAAIDASTSVSLSGQRSETAEVATELVPDVAEAEPLWSPPYELPLSTASVQTHWLVTDQFGRKSSLLARI